LTEVTNGEEENKYFPSFQGLAISIEKNIFAIYFFKSFQLLDISSARSMFFHPH
jgi:hypothetical protein